MLIPIIFVPYDIHNGYESFAAAFGNDWQEYIEADMEEKYFLETMFALPGYFLNIPAKTCEIIVNVEFYDGSESNFTEDNDITLYPCDAKSLT